MITLPRHKMTADEFLVWAEDLPREAGRFELWDGEVIVKRGPSGFENAERSEHWEVKFAIARALHDAVRRAGLRCHVAVEGPSVRFAYNRLVEPDALVYCGEKVPRGVLEVPNPIIAVEVLSPGTERMDKGHKLQGYFSLPSLHHYLVIDPDRPRLVHISAAPAISSSRILSPARACGSTRPASTWTSPRCLRKAPRRYPTSTAMRCIGLAA